MSQVIKAYQNLPPKTKQAINQAAAKTASAVAKAAVQTAQRRRTINAARRATTRTRQGQRIYDPTDLVETQAIAPVAYSTKWASGAKSMRVRQSEIVGPVTLDNTWFPSWHGTFSANTFPINPANPKTFPWLSYIARLYDKYRFHSLKFRFINAVATSTTGNIIIALDYDTLDAAPESVIEASQLAKFTMTPTYVPSDFTVPVSHPGNNPWLYTYDISAGTKDLKTYNLGNIFVCVDGLSKDGSVVGYLAVDYDVELLDKNPTIKLFASKTWDSAAPALKAYRSNVDPADTMNVTTSWEYTAGETLQSGYLQFDDDVPIGAKVRALVVVSAKLTVPSSSVFSKDTIAFDSTPDEGCTLLHQDQTVGYIKPGEKSSVSTAMTFDITVPVSRVFHFKVKIGSGTGTWAAPDTDYPWDLSACAYTYA